MERLLDELDYKRASELEQFLPDGVFSFGESYKNTTEWERAFTKEQNESIVSLAEKLLLEPEVEISEADACRYRTEGDGDRSICDGLYSKAIERIVVFALAECIENKGRFIDAYEKAVISQCNFKTWVLTAHDDNMDNFYGRNTTIDLHSACISWEIAITDFILNDKINPVIRKLIRENIKWRTFDPFERMLNGEQKPMAWFTITNNWNAVCLGTVLATAITVMECKKTRAVYLAAWEKYIKYFKSGFPDDGYCSEGISYWVYGFAHFLYPVELVRQATNGKLDYMNDPKIIKDACFGERMRMVDGVYPSIADCSTNCIPDKRPVEYINARLHGEKPTPCFDITRFYAVIMMAFDKFSENAPLDFKNPDPNPEYRSWFENVGVLISRKGSSEKCKLSVCLKGGNNQEHHNHNDVGSFTVVVNNTQIIADVGSERYCATTFSEHRYDSPFFNSYGHSVPLVGGFLQSPLKNVHYSDTVFGSKTIATEFSNSSDYYKLDLKDAYEYKEIRSITREFLYDRTGEGSLTITDDVEFDVESSFETAIMSYGECEIANDNASVKISIAGEALNIEFFCKQSKLLLSTEKLNGNISYFGDSLKGKLPTRIKIALESPVKAAKVICKITPAQ